MALSATGSGSDTAIWHDAECGGYRADLPLWLSLAAQAIPRPGSEGILEIGAGTGRLALALARAGHRVTAVETDRELADALRARSEGLPVTVIVADARELQTDGDPYGLAIAAMQTVQLLGGARGRRAFLTSMRRSLKPGAPIACAIVEDLELFDAAAGDEPPQPDTLTVGAARYESRVLRVGRDARQTVIERERATIDPGSATVVRRHLDRLDLLSADRLEREGERAGLRVRERAAVPATDDYVGSTVVILGA